MTKIDAGKLILEEAPLEIPAIISNLVMMQHDRADEKGIVLHTELACLPANLVGDATRLQQVLLNFLNNAIKFTEQGNITLRCHVVNETEASVLLRFEVSDSGIGISPETLNNLFNRFEQADSSTSRKFGGTGLGLAIAKEISNIMDGEAGATSELGVGSTFWFTARLKKGTTDTAVKFQESMVSAEELLKKDYQGIRILVAEDDLLNQEIISFMLEEVGLRVEIADDGVQAVALATQNDYRLILMDMQMPNMDGLAATRAIRQLSRYQTVPILAITANAFKNDQERCFAAGMNGFITKPTPHHELYKSLLQALVTHA